MSHRHHSILRPIVSALGACAVAFSLAACVSDAPSDLEGQDAPSDLEGQDASELEVAALPLSPPPSTGCGGSHTCCLSACGGHLYECNRGCREDMDPGPGRADCISWCHDNYSNCLEACDRTHIYPPPW
jgi:hypothetical protein